MPSCISNAFTVGAGNGSPGTQCFPAGVIEPVDVVDNADGTQTASYVPSREGPYSIAVHYGDDEVPRRYELFAF